MKLALQCLTSEKPYVFTLYLPCKGFKVDETYITLYGDGKCLKNEMEGILEYYGLTAEVVETEHGIKLRNDELELISLSYMIQKMPKHSS